MSLLVDTVNRFAEQLDDALEQHSAQIADAKQTMRDHATQLGAMNISLLAVRNEVLQRIDISENRVLLALDQVKQTLERIERKGSHG